MKSMLDRLIDMAIEEDIGSGDITTEAVILPGMQDVARIESKQDLIVAGLTVAEKIFAKIDPTIKWEPACQDGDTIEENILIAKVSGSVASILKAERVALNFLQHLSGVATFTNLFAKLVHGTKTKILDTRKTRPGYRELEKEAVRLGDGVNHRMGLYDRYLIKDNHIEAAGSISEAVARVKSKNKRGLLIEVEVADFAGANEAAEAGVDIIMLDNFTPSMVENAVAGLRGRTRVNLKPQSGVEGEAPPALQVEGATRAPKIEVSGNISIDNIREYARTGVDFISIGAITHSAPAADIHMILGN